MSDSGSGFSDDEDDHAGEGGGAMMSLFASYYGIQDSSNAANKSAAELIDSAYFDPSKYVQVQAIFP